MSPSQEIWHLETLGGLRIRGAGGTLSRFLTQKTEILLAYLALHPNVEHRREALADRIWPDGDAKQGRHGVNHSIYWIRKQLATLDPSAPDIFVSDRHTLRLDPAVIRTDLAEFERLVEEATGHDSLEERRTLFAAALARYQGDLLPGYYETWISHERERFFDLKIRATAQLALVSEQLGDFPRALHLAREVVRNDPYAEDHHYRLIRLHIQMGEMAAAKRQYEELRQMLAQEFGETPTLALNEVVGMQRQFGSRAPTLLVPESPTLAPPAASLIPAAFTKFVGRQPEIDRIGELLRDRDVRLISIVGPGGAGKTRLSQEVARRHAALLQGNVWFVPLADLSRAEAIPEMAVQALGLSPSSLGSMACLTAHLRGLSRTTLILDNFEHLTESGAPIVKELLRAVPSLTILVTTRRRLQLQGEYEVPVRSLPVPPKEDLLDLSPAPTPESLLRFPSVVLFVDRARMTRPDFALTDANARAVAELCARLEGLPLAIELAAASANTLSPAQIVDGLAHRLDLQASAAFDLPERHRSLRAAIEHSYEQLPIDLRNFFTRLATFAGGWTYEAAVEVCAKPFGDDGGRALTWLTELRDRSLILSEEDVVEGVGEIRFRMYETLREFADELIVPAERSLASAAHAGYFLALAEAMVATLGKNQELWLGRIASEYENFALVLKRALRRGDVDLGIRLIAALNRFWRVRHRLRECHSYLKELVALAEAREESPGTRLQAWTMYGNVCWQLERNDEALAVRQSTLDMARRFGTPRDVARCMNNLGLSLLSQAELQEARDMFKESFELDHVNGHDQEGILALANLGVVSWRLGEYAAAEAYLRQTLELAPKTDSYLVATCYSDLGSILSDLGRFPEAQQHLERSISIRRGLKDAFGVTLSLFALGRLARKRNRRSEARAYLEQALRRLLRLEEDRTTGRTLLQFAALLADEAPEKAIRILAHIGEPRAQALSKPEHDDFLAAWQTASTRLTEDRLADAQAEGISLDRPAIVETLLVGL